MAISAIPLPPVAFLAASVVVAGRATAGVRAEVNRLLDRTREAADSNHRLRSRRVRQVHRSLRVPADDTISRKGERIVKGAADSLHVF